ncbi:hypothetical protein D1871_16100 [Nakamurella silvestris]|nr:hypothetical protein D1871_16100 [Nakamurella silvestris]
MNDDDFDARFRARAARWNADFSEPAMPPLEARPPRRAWITPFAVATSLLAAATVTVVVAVQQPARPPVAGPAVIGDASTSSDAPATPSITREIPTTSTKGTLDHPNAVPTSIFGVEADPDDPYSIWVRAGQHGSDPTSWCTPQVYAFVTAESDNSVTLDVVEEGAGPKPDEITCVDSISLPERVKVTFREPIGTRAILDAGSSDRFAVVPNTYGGQGSIRDLAGVSEWFGVDRDPDDPRKLTITTRFYTPGTPFCMANATPIVVAQTSQRVEIAVARYTYRTYLPDPGRDECTLEHKPDLVLPITLEAPLGGRQLVDTARH